MKFNKTLFTSVALGVLLVISGCATDASHLADAAYYNSEAARYTAWSEVKKAEYAADALKAASAATAVANADASAKAATGAMLASASFGNTAKGGSDSGVPQAAQRQQQPGAFEWTQMLLGGTLPFWMQERSANYSYKAQVNSNENNRMIQESTNSTFLGLGREIKPNYTNSFNTFAPAPAAAPTVIGEPATEGDVGTATGQ